MSAIHPTAIIEDGARIGEGTAIGPYALVGADVVLGAGCRVMGHAVLAGRTSLGQGNYVGHGAVIGAPPQDFAFDPALRSEVRIGDKNTFREHVTIHSGTGEGGVTSVGSGNFVMAGAHFGHNVRVGDGAVVANNCLLAGHCEIGDRAVLGGGTVFHQFVRIGRLCMVRGGTRFGKDIPPFLVADGENIVSGLNAVGLRRAGISREARLELSRLFKLVFRGGLNVSQALAEASRSDWGPEAREMLDFIGAAKKRGICLAHGTRPAGSPDDG